MPRQKARAKPEGAAIHQKDTVTGVFLWFWPLAKYRSDKVGHVSSEVPHGPSGALSGLDRLAKSLDAIKLSRVAAHLAFSTAGFTLGATHAG